MKYLLILLPSLLMSNSCSHTQAHYLGECVVEEASIFAWKMYDSTICDLPPDISRVDPERRDAKYRRKLNKRADVVTDKLFTIDTEEIEAELESEDK